MTARATASRRRDAAETKQLLLEAALRRFAGAGYAATTVRDIADDAGVNLALISRYFRSKEGLFEACLTSAVDDLERTTGDVPLSRIPDVIAEQITAAEGLPNTLVLLLRSSGDAGADRIRRELLRTLSERLAATAGWRPGDDDLLLRAQVVLAASCGIALMRATTGMQPLAATTARDLEAPLRDLVGTLLR